MTYSDGQIYYIEYLQNGFRHNLHDPSYMLWHNDKLDCISYWQNGLRHNMHGIAYMEWYDDCQICYIQYSHFGKLIKEYRF